MTGFFITSSGTGIGKTVVTELLIRQARAEGLALRAIKPVISGFDPLDTDNDTQRLARALGGATSVEAISPWRFKAPLSPDMAAAREGRRLDVAELAAFCRPRGEALLLVEGIGGVMVPLNARATVLDWMALVALPIVLVVGSYLGTLSHALTAAAALRGRGLDVAAVVVSESEDSPVPLTETVATLERFLTPIPVVALGRLPLQTEPSLLAMMRRDRGAGTGKS